MSAECKVRSSWLAAPVRVLAVEENEWVDVGEVQRVRRYRIGGGGLGPWAWSKLEWELYARK